MATHFLKLAARCLLIVMMVAARSLCADGVKSQFSNPPVPGQLVDWRFQEDFSKGIPGWMSYPLPQDVGYDPTIYTGQRSGNAVLVRDVVAQKGDHRLRIGLVRPLLFHAGAGSMLRLDYGLETSGHLSKVKVLLGSVSGRQYVAELPLESGRQQVQIFGRNLGLPSSGDDIEATVIEALVEQPLWGSHNRLTIFAFGINAQRVANVPLRGPRLTYSEGMQVSVADAVFSSEKPLRIQLETPNRAATLVLLDRVGKEISHSTFTGAVTHNWRQEAPGLWTAIIESATGRSEFRFLLLGTIPAHPRVLLSTARLAELKNDSLLRDLIHRKFQQLAAVVILNPWAGENIEQLSPVSVLAGLPQYFTQMENYSNAASVGALDYVLNQNADGLTLARKILLDSAMWPSWTPPWFSAHGLHTYYGTGMFSERLALTYDLIATRLSSPEKSQIAEGILRNSIDPAIDEYFLNDRMPIAASNHMAHAIGGAIADCVALEGDVPDWEEKFAPKLAQLTLSYEELMKGLFPGDESEAEPAGYEAFAMEGTSWGAAALDSLGIHPDGLEKMLEAFWWERYIRLRADLILDSGDFDGDLASLPGFAWSAEHTHDPSLRAFYESDNSRSVAAISRSRDSGRALESMPGLLDLVCCTGSATEPAAAVPPSRVFPLRGSAVLRSGWGQDDTLISLRAGPWFNHEHHDQGTFQVAAFGEKLIDEAGYSDYYTDPRYLDYFTQAPGHNTVIVDHNPFSQGDYDGRYWRGFSMHPAITSHLFSEHFDYLAADLAPAYKGTLKQFTREYLFLKPGLLIVRDHVSSSDAHDYSWLLHTPPGTKTTVHNEQATITGSKGAVLISTSEGNWSTVSEPVPVIAYRDFQHERIFPRSAFELETPKQVNHTFLVGMRLLKLPVTGSPLDWKKESNAVVFSLHAGSDEVHGAFRTSAGKLSAGSATTDGDALIFAISSSARDLFASEIKNVNEAPGLVFRSTVPVDLVLHESGGAREFHIASATSTRVSFSLPTPPSTFLVDEKPVAARYLNGTISVDLAEGEHVVIVQP